MLRLLDIFFTVFHIGLVLFNLSGWIWAKTRKAHLITITATLASWFILGAWYGWGYCPFTEWHWQVKEKLGEQNLPSSFIKYYADKISGKNIDAAFVDRATLAVFIVLTIVTVYINFIKGKIKHGK